MGHPYQFGDTSESIRGALLELDIVSKVASRDISGCHKEYGVEWYGDNGLLKVQCEVEATATRRPRPWTKRSVRARCLRHWM